MTHKCKVCGVTSDAAKFYAGINTRCKECHKAKVRENRKAKADYYRTYDAYRYKNDPKVRQRHRRYHKTDAGKAAMAEARDKWLRENAEKRACHTIVNNAVRDGRLSKPDACQSCGATDCRIEGHHDDYAKPLDVRWVCRSCHVEIHRQENENLVALQEAAKKFDPNLKSRGRHAT
jgi:hypothetical protein